MAPATKKQRVNDGASASGVADPAPELNHDENDNDDDSDDDESPMSIIAQFQSEDVRHVF